ncbi:hypothetical protein ABW20_dc0109264 [Dactylellina cionopaga]|nr:hypothetical protein ABW20_dc0109264 [Dactylellina cionopaga]
MSESICYDIPDNASDSSLDPDDLLRESMVSVTSSMSSNCSGGPGYDLSRSMADLTLDPINCLLDFDEWESVGKLSKQSGLANTSSTSTSPASEVNEYTPTNTPTARGAPIAQSRMFLSKDTETVSNGVASQFSVKEVPSPISEGYVSIFDIKSALCQFRSHGNNGQQAGSEAGSGSSSGGGSPSYPSHVIPPYLWGSRGQEQGNGNDDDNEGPSSRRDHRQKTKKRIACPAAKGDWFHNLTCLGISFPNLAKARQHVAVSGNHFKLKSTTLLPNELRDPAGWDAMQNYIYPMQEVPSSEDDYRETLEVIYCQGAGQGKPDFRSYVIRMLENCLEDHTFAGKTLSMLYSIDSEQPVNDRQMVPHPNLKLRTHTQETSSYRFELEALEELLKPSSSVPEPMQLTSGNQNNSTGFLNDFYCSPSNTGSSHFQPYTTNIDPYLAAPAVPAPDRQLHADYEPHMDSNGPAPDPQTRDHVRFRNASGLTHTVPVEQGVHFEGLPNQVYRDLGWDKYEFSHSNAFHRPSDRS